jgi:hypothetical protein
VGEFVSILVLRRSSVDAGTGGENQVSETPGALGDDAARMIDLRGRVPEQDAQDFHDDSNFPARIV